jgi:hypothetical protein
MDQRTYKEMMDICNNIMIDEVAKGKLGSHTGDSMKGARVAQGGGRLGTFTPARGIGASKSTQNNPKADDKRISNYKDQLKKDKASEKGVTPEQRRERARKNKETKAKAGIDALLKDIRGK